MSLLTKRRSSASCTSNAPRRNSQTAGSQSRLQSTKGLSQRQQERPLRQTAGSPPNRLREAQKGCLTPACIPVSRTEETGFDAASRQPLAVRYDISCGRPRGSAASTQAAPFRGAFLLCGFTLAVFRLQDQHGGNNGNNREQSTDRARPHKSRARSHHTAKE